MFPQDVFGATKKDAVTIRFANIARGHFKKHTHATGSIKMTVGTKHVRANIDSMH